MSVHDLVGQLSALCSSGERLISVGRVQDLLLDIRSELRDHREVALVVDRHLVRTLRRSWFTPDEAAVVMQDLLALLTRRPAASSARRLGFGSALRVPRRV